MRLLVNEGKNTDENFTMEIKGITSDIQILNYKIDNFNEDNIMFLSHKIMLILQNPFDYIIYFNNIFNNSINIIKAGKYIDGMESEDFLNANEKYFSNFSDNFLFLPKDEINIIFFNYKKNDQIHLYVSPKNISKNIEIKGKATNFLYLEKDKEYTLDFQNNTIDRMIKLSRKSLKSEIIIEDKENNITLNKDNLYYKLKDNNGAIQLYVKNDDALIEFLFKQNDTNILDFKNNQYISKNQYNLIKIPKIYKSKEFNMKIVGKNALILLFYFGYSIPPYSYYHEIESQSTLKSKSNEVKINLKDLYKDDIKLMEDEYYCILIKNVDSKLDLVFKIDKEENAKKDSNKLETWEIILIVIGLIAGLLLIIVIILFCCKKKKVTSKEIEEKILDIN